jgi:hypothetical protein
MKQTFYVHQYSDGQLCFYSENKSIKLPQIGTITLDVQPIKKEVEKVIDANCIEDSTLHYVRVNQRIPVNAYNVKVTYTVKE